ncbi:hypothetical protein M406DRAFT_251646, partial [Cryphonectria parasitica EP155]
MAYDRFLEKDESRAETKEEELGRLRGLLASVYTPWLVTMNKSDPRKAYVWRHMREDEVDIYRLDDHVWLWTCLEEIEALRIRQGLDPRKAALLIDDDEDDNSRPLDAQRGLLQRFTTENEVSQQRMLAVTRSHRETRFLFHARDTALFYAHDWNFFQLDKSFDELWKRTIKSQSHHNENADHEWENVLRFGMAIVAGTRNFPINKKSANDLLRDSFKALVQASCHNGLVAGQVDALSRKPSFPNYSSDEDRQYYHQAGFEICHILLLHARRIEATLEPQLEVNDQLRQIFLTQPKRQGIGAEQPANKLELILKLLDSDGRLGGQRSLTMRKSTPFNSMIDASSISLLDEEWLYKYPDFLMTKKIDLPQLLKSLEAKKSFESTAETIGTIVGKGLEQMSQTRSNTLEYGELPGWFIYEDIYGPITFVASTPKQKHLKRRQNLPQFWRGESTALGNTGLWMRICGARSAETAKKRFVWLPHTNIETSLLCWSASSDSDKSAVSLFFDRHSRYESHLWDDTTLVLNIWQTKIHMRFFVLADKARAQHIGLPAPSSAPFPGTSEKEIRRASMGFRFDGDLFDRYWTCHFIQYLPNLRLKNDDRDVVNPQRSWDFEFYTDGSNRPQDKHWWQRKVLELHLLHRMLSAAVAGSVDILTQIRKELGIGESALSFSILNSQAHSRSRHSWQEYEHILQAAEEDLTSILKTLQKWDTREYDRGPEKPRWTRNDEKKYRGHINKFRSQTERQAWDLEIHRDNMRNLRETLTTIREKARED